MAKIPSLCDLWQNTEDEGEVNSEAYRSEDHGIASDDTGNNMPASNIPGEIDQGLFYFMLKLVYTCDFCFGGGGRGHIR
jgi:hypothetical protein